MKITKEAAKEHAENVANIAEALLEEALKRNVQMSIDTACTSAAIIYGNLHCKSKG